MTTDSPLEKMERLIQAEQSARTAGQQLYEFLYAMAKQELFNSTVRDLGRRLAARLGENNFSPSSLTDSELEAVADILAQLENLFDHR
ncbi:MAG: hypothetical protein KJ621_07340 [Proteobacteria bacterium]|nr:hypothetical protein [Pseudomonadota bacterium]